LSAVVAERGTGILLVEHDMALVRQVCAHIYVLDFGRLVFEGTADEMLASDVVRAAYLGSEEEVLEEEQAGPRPTEQVTEPA
jgi:ABC-type branched-subunit amino acid transport system ATPase component